MIAPLVAVLYSWLCFIRFFLDRFEKCAICQVAILDIKSSHQDIRLFLVLVFEFREPLHFLFYQVV